MFTGADWLVVIGALGAAIAGLVGAWWQGKRQAGTSNEVEVEERPRKTLTVALAEDDRTLIHSASRRLDDALADHRRAIEEQTAALKRKDDD